ncbi:MAG: hypothetical protein A4E61_00741 [Syntrophorhabdus sp. PtaB.Bin184]|nr:MAG: hypothetical protein A4E61_00741 [Syntrophorhabdus sp. PtaB.Bin184]
MTAKDMTSPVGFMKSPSNCQSCSFATASVIESRNASRQSGLSPSRNCSKGRDLSVSMPKISLAVRLM